MLPGGRTFPSAGPTGPRPSTVREEGLVLAASSLFHNSHLFLFSVLFILEGAPHLSPGRQISFPTLFLQPNSSPSFFRSAGHPSCPQELKRGLPRVRREVRTPCLACRALPTASCHCSITPEARDSPAAHQPSGVCPLLPGASCSPPAFLQAHGRLWAPGTGSTMGVWEQPKRAFPGHQYPWSGP